MSNTSNNTKSNRWHSEEMNDRIRRRYAAERRFKIYGITAVLISLLALLTLMTTIIATGYGGFMQSQIKVEVYFDPAKFGNLAEMSEADRDQAIASADYAALIRESLMVRFPEVSSRREVMSLSQLISPGANQQLRDIVTNDPDMLGQRKSIWLISSDDADTFIKGNVSRDAPESQRRIKDNEISWLDALEADGNVKTTFNWHFLTSGDSREPEIAGIWGATMGSLFTLIVTLSVAFPVGVCAAVYLEEFAPQNRWTDLIEVNINNLAAVPSIVFGLLGLALFLNVMHLPRSAPLVGGLTLALMTLPTIIISSRAAIKAVPNSIRQAGVGLGASPVQVVAHHVLPQAMPGILTGTIIGMAQALGETAPLLMIGMVAFVVDVPGSISDAATVLPVQIFLWADSPERAFVEKTSAAIMVLLAFLVLMNAAAIWLRQKFEGRR